MVDLEAVVPRHRKPARGNLRQITQRQVGAVVGHTVEARPRTAHRGPVDPAHPVNGEILVLPVLPPLSVYTDDRIAYGLRIGLVERGAFLILDVQQILERVVGFRP